MRKLLLLSFLIIAVIAHARQISEGEAASIASEFLNSAAVRQTPSKAGVRRAKAPNAANAEAAPFYVYNADDNQGFVIVSGDDRTNKILGYSNKGNFDYDNMPPQLKAVLDSCQMNLNRLTDITHVSWNSHTVASSSAGEEIILNTANWGQGYPYNLYTPEISGEKTLTGCVATAMSIVMKFNQWPSRARGGEHKWLNDNDQLTLNFDDFTFDFNNMPDNYTEGNFSEDQASEVSRLMQAAGAAVKTQYSVTASGANNWPIGHCMFENFLYSPESQYVYSGYFSDEEWINMVKIQINQNHPVILTGVNFETKGHAFVCDGFNQDNYLHVNWGWEGVNNGFFDPFMLGGFNSYIGMVINLYPDADARPEEYSPHYIDATGRIKKSYKTVETVRQNEPFDVHLADMHLVGNKPVGHFSVALTDADGKFIEVWKYESIFPEYTIDENWSLNQYDITGIIFKSKMQSDYRLQVVELLDNDECRIVLGTIDSPTSISVDGFECDMSSLCYDIVDPDNIIKGKEYLKDYTIPTGSDISQIIDVSGGVATIYIDGQYIGSVDGFMYSVPICFCLSDNRHVIRLIGKKYSDLVSKSYDVATPGSLSSLISPEDKENIYKLKISGNINIDDLLFMSTELHYMRHLDLRLATIVASQDNRKNYFPGIFTKDEETIIMQWNIDNIILPDNLEGLEDAALYLRYGEMPVLSMPPKLKDYGSATLMPQLSINTYRFAKVENPIPTDEESGLFLSLPEMRAGVILYVPVGSKELYEKSSAWQGFMEIRETDAPYVGEFVADDHYRYTAFTDFAIISGSSYFDDQDSYYLVAPKDIEIDGKTYPVHTNTPELLELYLTENENFELSGQVWNLISNKLKRDYSRTATDFYSTESTDILWVPGACESHHILDGYRVLPMWNFKIDKVKKLIKINTIQYQEAVEVVIDNIKINGVPVTQASYGHGLYVFDSLDNLTIEVMYSLHTSWNGRPLKECSTSTLYTPEFLGQMESTDLHIPCTSISLDPISAEGFVGEQIQISATVFPENAKKTLSWSSLDESIATVSDTGLVSLIKEGTTVILASATNESVVTASAECAVTVLETSGIGDVLSDKSVYVRIFNMQGIQVYEGPYSEAKLAPDYYIVVCGGKSIKVKTE